MPLTYSLAGILVLALVFYARPAEAFGAGYVARGSSRQGVNYRHGDILLNVYFLTHVHSTLTRQIYFGNWLRDFSQLIDRKAIELVPEPILRAVVAIFAHLQFGYSTGEFEVTSERLGCYRPEEHIDNPKGYEGGSEHPPYTQLRLQVLPEELAIQRQTGMKNYVRNEEFTGVNETSLAFIERQLVAAIACGRARDPEAYTHLGAALHTLEDFVAHSNWVELCIQMLGAQNTLPASEAMVNVFAFTGGAAKVETARGLYAPLVTGTFGALDLYQSLLGEAEDKVSALSLPGLQRRINGPHDDFSTTSKALLTLLAGIGGDDFLDDIKSISKFNTQEPADWGKLNETPAMLWEALQPIFKVRDKIVRWVYDHLTIDAVANAIAKISTAIDKFIYAALGVVLSPVLKDISGVLQQQSTELLVKDQQVKSQQGEGSIFDSKSKATDPTHSQLCKDHYDHPLNALAGRVAVKITTFTMQRILDLWQPGNTTDVRPALSEILATLHHPGNYSKEGIQAFMVAEVVKWCTEASPEVFLQLDRAHMMQKLGEEAEQVAHSHVPTFTAAYTSSDQVGGTTVHDLTTIGVVGPHAGFTDRICKNIEKSGVKIDMAEFRKTMEATPSANAPNPMDQAFTIVPGQNLLSAFDDIDIGEIVAVSGMGLVLKDSLISMRLRDSNMVEREQIKARETLATLQDRPVKAMLALLDINARSSREKEEQLNSRPTEESKMKRLMNKLKLGDD